MFRNLPVLFLGIALIFSTPNVYAKVLKIATLAPDGTTWMKEMRKGAEEIAEKTAGRVKIKFYPGGVMGNDKSVLRKMRVGQLQGGAFSSGELVNIYSGSQIYSLPFLFHTYEEVDYVRQHVDQLIHKGLKENGMTVLGISEGGFAYVMCNEPLKSAADLKGHRVWIPENDMVSQAMFEAAGVSPIPLPMADVYTGLQTGLIDTVANTSMGAIAFQWHTKMGHITDSPMLLIMGILVVDNKAFGKLKPLDQKIVTEVMDEVFRRLDKLNRVDNDKARLALQEQGVVFHKPSESEVAYWKEIASTALKTLGERGVYPRDLLTIIQNHLKDLREKSKP